MIAPRVATRIDQRLNPVSPAPPSNCTTKPPTSAPIIPMTIVSRKPPGSLPGMISLPKIPAISPITIQLMMPIPILFSYLLFHPVLLFRGISLEEFHRLDERYVLIRRGGKRQSLALRLLPTPALLD